MNIQSALEKLFSLHQFGIKLGLDNINKLLLHIGNPQIKLQGFHIAGSNGKGSTASFMASILQEAGFKVGLYTSPHFVKFNERIRINGIQVPDEFIRLFMTEFAEYIDVNNPTFFELTTAMAFKYFAENKVDYAVIETGLGGRLDATNTFMPIASVITSISLEHTNILGDSLSKIAAEKAGIIKENNRVFISVLPQEAKNILREYANNKKSRLFQLEDYVDFFDDYLILRSNENQISFYNTPLPGRHQLINASLAVLTLLATFKNLSTEFILNGIANVVTNTGIEGRYEIFSRTPRVIFDSAHNPEGIDAFLNEFLKEKHRYKKCSVIYGAMRDKSTQVILEKLNDNFDEIFVTSINYERAATIDELLAVCKNTGISASSMNSPADFIRDYINDNEGKCLVVLGSMYILGEIKTNLINST